MYFQFLKAWTSLSRRQHLLCRQGSIVTSCLTENRRTTFTKLRTLDQIVLSPSRSWNYVLVIIVTHLTPNTKRLALIARRASSQGKPLAGSLYDPDELPKSTSKPESRLQAPASSSLHREGTSCRQLAPFATLLAGGNAHQQTGEPEATKRQYMVLNTVRQSWMFTPRSISVPKRTVS